MSSPTLICISEFIGTFHRCRLVGISEAGNITDIFSSLHFGFPLCGLHSWQYLMVDLAGGLFGSTRQKTLQSCNLSPFLPSHILQVHSGVDYRSPLHFRHTLKLTQAWHVLHFLSYNRGALSWFLSISLTNQHNFHGLKPQKCNLLPY